MGPEVSAFFKPIWLVPAAAVTWLVVAVPFLTNPHPGFMDTLLLAIVWLTIGVIWIVRSIAQPALLHPHVGKAWLSVPLVGCLGVLLLLGDRGLVLRTLLSRKALEDHILNMAADGGPADGGLDRTGRWVGLFYVENTMEYNGVVYLYTGSGFLNRYGIAHVPPGKAPAPRIRFLSNLVGNWHHFEWRW